MGHTLNSLMSMLGIDRGNPNDLTADVVQKRMKYALVPDQKVWIVSIRQDLLSVHA